MKGIKKNTLFFTGIFLAFIAGMVELWLFILIIKSGQIDLFKGVITLLNGGFVFGTTKMLIQAWKSEFIKGGVLDLKDFSQCHVNRLQEVKSKNIIKPFIIKDLDSKLITHYLTFLERILKKNLGEYHYEFSLFCNAEFPEIIAYYDSNLNTSPRSKEKRIKDKEYYIKEKYEVVELLRNPSSIPHYIANTQVKAEDYSFSSEEQKKNVRSTLIHCIDFNWPAALVITCDKERVLGIDDHFKEAFLAIFKAIATDMYIGALMKNGV